MLKSQLLICCCLFLNSLFAQTDIRIGSKMKIYSDSLKEEIALQVYLPDSYEDADQDYPVLYILDGQWYFLNGVAIQEGLRSDRIMPKMIVVGIDMVDRPYRSKLMDQWGSLIAFVETELISYIDDTYRTSNERVVFGWENNAFLVSELALKGSSPFSCAIVASGADVKPEQLQSLNLNKDRYLYIGGSEKDIYTVDLTDKAAELLESNNVSGLHWKYELLNEEEHETLAYASLYRGLKFFYHNYRSLVFSSIDDFNERGGIPFLKQYFKERGERFSLPTEIDDATKNSLIWLAWNRDQFEAFELFMNAFSDVLTTRRYANAYWQNRLARYYLKYRSFDQAVSFFERGINEYPDDRYNAAMHAGLGLAYSGKGETKLAKQYLKEGIKLAKAANDPQLAKYEEQLKSIK